MSFIFIAPSGWVSTMAGNRDSEVREAIIQAYGIAIYSCPKFWLFFGREGSMGDGGSAAGPAVTHADVISKSISERVETRYKDAYRVAGFIVGFGTLLKFIGGLLGSIIVVIGFASASRSSNILDSPFGNSGSGTFWGIFVFALFFMAGVGVSAQGQAIQASLDSAVNSSPFLDLAAKARAMGVDGDDNASPTQAQAEQESLSKLGWPGHF